MSLPPGVKHIQQGAQFAEDRIKIKSPPFLNVRDAP